MRAAWTTASLIAGALLLTSLSAPAHAQDISEETVEFFQTNCTSCHTIGGGKLAGPDLKNVTERKDAAWVSSFIMDPKAVIDSGDAYAQNLLKEARGVYMPTLPGMPRSRADKLVELITYESAKEKSRFAGLEISDRPLTPADLLRGERLFRGDESFSSGAPACISCHDIDGLSALGGGRLGPDLTDVYSRLEGRKALSAWLGAPATATMQPIYKNAPLDGDEVLGLVAYLQARAENGQPGAGNGPLSFLFAGLVGVAGVLIAFDLIWRRRFRAVRRPLVRGLSR